MKKTLILTLTVALIFSTSFSYAASTNIKTAQVAPKTTANLQWAFSNDGTFTMESNKNTYPVMEMGRLYQNGLWTQGPNFGKYGGSNAIFSKDSSTKAEAGIDIGLAEAEKLFKGGKRQVVVALIDSGVDINHPALKNRIWVNTDEIPGNGIDDDHNGFIDDINGWNFSNMNNQVRTGKSNDGHGTHNAGTIAGVATSSSAVHGIFTGDNIKIMVIDVLGGLASTGESSSIYQAIKYAEANGADICNLSLSGAIYDSRVFSAMASSKMLFVCAAGNETRNIDYTPVYPACYGLDNVISVANMNYNGHLYFNSNYGKYTADIAAPGSYILSTYLDGGYCYMSGTSMAAPMVSAAAAMAYSYYEGITPRQTKQIILESAKKLDVLKDVVGTGGMLYLPSIFKYDIKKLTPDSEYNVKAMNARKNPFALF